MKMWEVEFGSWTNFVVVAPNIKEAMNRAMSKRKGEYSNRVQDITKIELLATED